MKGLIKWVLNHLPRTLLQRIAGWLMPLVGLWYRGNRYACPLCGRTYRKMLPYGYVTSRENALCPHCLSLERHRLLWLYLERETTLFSSLPHLLHIAPEVCLMRHLKPHYKSSPERYKTADLESPLADLHFDIQQIPLRRNVRCCYLQPPDGARRGRSAGDARAAPHPQKRGLGRSALARGSGA